MLRLVEHALTGETYALSFDFNAEEGEAYIFGAWAVPRSTVLHPDGSLWVSWDQECWQRMPENDQPGDLAFWAEQQEPWRVLAEVST